MIEAERIKVLNDLPVDCDGQYVLYWMQQSQRESLNPALEYAARCANKLGLPVVVVFGLDATYPDANRRHFAFMLEGLAETADRVQQRGAGFVIRFGSPPDVAAEVADDAALVVCDRGYLRHQRQWRKELCTMIDKRIVQVEGDVVVPVETASDKQEWAARTIRRKVNDHRDAFVRTVSRTRLGKRAGRLNLPSDVAPSDWQAALEQLDIDRDVQPVDRFPPGPDAARAQLTRFIRDGLVGYASARNDPSNPKASEMSPYLHFGQISPVEIAHKVQRSEKPSDADKEAFLEELIVRRELACNFVYFTPDYDSYQCLPDWARQTLAKHRSDERPVRYTRGELEAAETDDPYWNAAMREMRHTGYMHNYMRMYWGKKILEWTNTPEYAYSTALYLNNRYFLDGRDPNSYANIGWLFGLHDRAWAERSIFGKVRYMSASGLERKFDVDKYVEWAQTLAAHKSD